MATLPIGHERASSPARDPSPATALWAGVPWFVWASALSVTLAVVGLHFDISWHRSIGRDSFWNPAHEVLYSSGILAAIACVYLIVATTFGHNKDLTQHSVQVWGLRAPLGAFVAAWGGVGTLYDAAFDNWWHNAYGLDVRFTSPPHLLFSMSLWFSMLGGLLVALSYMNRADSGSSGLNRPRLQALVLWMGGMMVTAQLFACFSYTWDTKLHTAKPYIAVSVFLPVVLALIARATRFRWACTAMCALYTALLVVLILVLPLFPATPRLGPIYIPVTHFIPPRFPLLVLLPAVALDLLWQRGFALGRTASALVSGVIFTAVLTTAEWPFANFLISEHSANRFFGTRYLGFDDLAGPPDATLWQFAAPDHGLHLLLGLTLAAACAAAGTYAGTVTGDALRRVRR